MLATSTFPLAESPSPLRTGSSPLSIALLLGLSLILGAIWWHNRAYLRDLYDYSMIVAGVAKAEAGLRPYTDMRSPMQSAIYLLNSGVEAVLGGTFLRLTWGGLLLSWAGTMLVWAMARRALRPVLAVLLAGAVGCAGLAQHTVIFYNPLGVLSLALVLLGLAIEPRFWPLRTWRSWVVAAALFLGGMNKLNFQGVTLGLALLFVLCAWQRRQLTWRETVLTVAMLFLFGTILPIGFELAWTGASFVQWFENVVLLPESRLAGLGQIARPDIWLRPPHDFHHHVLVPCLSGIGLICLGLVGAGLVRAARRRKATWIELGLIVLLMIASALGGALLLVSNNETVLLTSLPLLVVAVAWWVGFAEAGRSGFLSTVITAACLLWTFAGAYAAWHGSRVLYAHNPPPRSAYREWRPASPRLAYFFGVKLLPDQSEAWDRVGAKLEEWSDANDGVLPVLFGPGMEWLERGSPETIQKGAPLWWDDGTTLRERDAGYFRWVMQQRQAHLVVQTAWEHWPASIRKILEQEYRKEPLSGRDAVYSPRRRPVPVAEAVVAPTLYEFRDRLGSNVQPKATRLSPGLRLEQAGARTIFGSRGSSHWQWPLGASDAQGEAVARWESDAAGSGTVTFRVVAGDPWSGDLLAEWPVRLSATHREVVIPFALQPGGRALSFQIDGGDNPNPSVVAGWQQLRITHTNEADRSAPAPFNESLTREISLSDGELWFVKPATALPPAGWAPAEVEIWRRIEPRAGKIRVALELEVDPSRAEAPFAFGLAWYRGGRFEIMTEKTFDWRVTPSPALETYVTEPGGWVGVFVRHAGPARHVRVSAWEH